MDIPRQFSHISCCSFYFAFCQHPLDAGQLVLVIMQIAPLLFIISLHILVHRHLILRLLLNHPQFLQFSFLLQNVPDKVKDKHHHDPKHGKEQKSCFSVRFLLIPGNTAQNHNHDHYYDRNIPITNPVRARQHILFPFIADRK